MSNPVPKAAQARLASRRASRAARQARITAQEAVLIESSGSFGYVRGLRFDKWEISDEQDVVVAAAMKKVGLERNPANLKGSAQICVFSDPGYAGGKSTQFTTS